MRFQPIKIPHYLVIYIFWTGYGVHSLMEEEEEGKDAQYKFEYSVRDSKTGNYQSREEELMGDKLRGQYSLHDPDGYKRTVVYKVDGPSGFVAKVYREKISTCPHCKDSSEPFAAGYEISHRSPDSYVNSYFYMGSGLSSSVVSLGKDGVRVFTKTRHLHS